MRVGLNCLLVGEVNFGVEVAILELARSLVSHRGKDELVCYSTPSLPSLDTQSGFRQVFSPPLTNVRAGRIAWEQFWLPYLVNRDRLDLLHAPGYILPLASRVPVVLTVHDLLALKHPELCRTPNRIHYGLLLPASIRRARRILVLSESVRREILERFGLPESRVTVVRPGVEPGFFAPPSTEDLARVRETYDLPSKFVLFSGRLEPKKNLPRLLKAYGVARERGLEAELILMGRPGWGPSLLRDVEEAKARWIGYVPRSDVPLIFRLASVLAFPSLVEGFGLPVLEALASGLPVVCSAVPAAEEIGLDSVIQVDPLSIGQIANGLLSGVHDESLRQDLIQRGVGSAKGFTWSRAAQHTWQVYRELGER